MNNVNITIIIYYVNLLRNVKDKNNHTATNRLLPPQQHKVAVIDAALQLNLTRWKLKSQVGKKQVNTHPMTSGRVNGAIHATSAAAFNKQQL